MSETEYFTNVDAAEIASLDRAELEARLKRALEDRETLLEFLGFQRALTQKTLERVHRPPAEIEVAG